MHLKKFLYYFPHLVVTASFISSSYNYTEDHGEVSDIKLHLSKCIANNLNVIIAGGMLNNI